MFSVLRLSFFFQAEDGIRDGHVTGVQTCALPIWVLDDVAARLTRTQSDIGGQGTETVPQRVATALLRLADKLGTDRGPGGIMLEVPLSRADLAGLARSTPESVSRVMSGWKRQDRK